MYCDSKGFAWISSMDGLNRFDGVRAITYRPVWPGKKYVENFITGGFFEDKESNIWFGTINFIGCYIRKLDSIALYSIRDNGENIKNNVPFYLEPNGKLWIRSDFGIFTFSIYEHTSKKIMNPIGYNRCRMSSIGKNNYLLYAFETSDTAFTASVYNVRDELVTSKLQLRTAEVGIVSDICPIVNRLWIVSLDKGLIEADLYGKNLYFHSIKDPRIGSITALCQKGDSLIVSDWSKNIWYFDWKKKKITGSAHLKNGSSSFNENDQIIAIYRDHLNCIWASFKNSGVFYGNLGKPKINELLLPPQSTPKGDYRSFVKDSKGSIWSVFNSQQIIRYRKDMSVSRVYNILLKKDNILIVRIFCDKAGNIWALAREGIYRYHENEDRFVNEIPRGASESSHYITQLNDGHLLLSSRVEGLYMLNTSSMSLIEVSLDDKYKKPFTTTFQDSKGRVYAALNDEKILVFDYKANSFKAIAEIPISGEVNAFLEIPGEKSIWIAASMGLIRLNCDDYSKFSVFNEKDGLANTYIHQILMDRSGLFWLSTYAGISSFNRQNRYVRNYSIADGVAGLEFITGSGLYDAENDLIVLGGTEGANYFHPEKLHNLTQSPSLQITGLRYNDKVPLRGFSTEMKKAVFSYSQNTITFDFVSIDYADPANNRVAYRLQNYDNHWDTLSAPNGSARYAQLREGKYTFEVIGANSDGVWNPEPRTIEVEILPPFYRTWWFYMLEVLALAGLIGGGVKIYVDKKLRTERTKQDKLLALQKERDRIASEMHDDVGAGLTAIRLMSDRIQRQVQDNKLSQQINRITVQAGDLVENMSSIIWAMNSSNDTYQGLFQYMRRYALEYLTETNDLSASFPMTDSFPDLSISGERRRQIFLAFKESLHNIVKHAGAGTIAIQVVFDAEKMKIQVADNGKGIPTDRKNGNGLVNMAKRMENIGGQFSATGNIPQGTVIQFEIPLAV